MTKKYFLNQFIRMKRSIRLLACMMLLTGSTRAQTNFASFVNPFIGTGGHGHTYPGATLPHGMVQLSPDTRLDGWDGCGGYHYSDSFMYGFSHTHLSGTGVSDYGDILLMPMSSRPSPDNKIYGSRFNHIKEKAAAGFYQVMLQDDQIMASLTATTRVGFHRYAFPAKAAQHLVLDLKHRDEVIESSIRIEDSVTVTGMRRSKAWATNQYVFFVMKFSRPIMDKGIWLNDTLQADRINELNGFKNLKAFFSFNQTEADSLLVKVAISPVSVAGAINNLEAELPGWNFDQTKEAATTAWNAELSRISVTSKDTNKLAIFYSALYHTAIVPNINMDVDHQYRGRDNAIHLADGFNYYSVFSLWDTYRGAHPLYTIIDQARTVDYIKTFLVQFQQGGRLPVWELASNETDCMIGYHSVPVIADAYLKGINDFDTTLALEAMKKSANWDHLGLPAYISNGLLETGDEPESVSKTLEYAYDDWCIAQFANKMGNRNDYLQYMKRSQFYKNLFDPATGFMRPRKNGDWLKPFDPREVNNYFTEANSWQYSFYMPQDIPGYVQMSGGIKKFENRLDSLFAASSQTTGRDQSDITGLIGQYAHGNEPSHHIIYLYNYTNSPYKTQKLVQQVMQTMYQNSPDGLIGNEDCGQMSAWYVLSALGFYPVTPGSNQYMIGSPLFNLAEIQLENGKSFIINAANASEKNIYVQQALLSTAASLRPRNWDTAFLRHEDIVQGGLVTFMMGEKPSKWFGSKLSVKQPSTAALNIPFVLNPVIGGGKMPYKNSKRIPISCSQKNCRIFYTLDGSDPSELSSRYLKPLQINSSLTVKAIAIDQKGNKSFITQATYRKIPHNWAVNLLSSYEPQYDGGGAEGLVDGIRGTTNWRMGNWQGYQKTDMNVQIDLGKVQPVSKVTAGFLQDTRAWIVVPSKIAVEVSVDGKKYQQVYSGEDFLAIEDLQVQIKQIEASFKSIPARYIRIRAHQFGKLPSWHEGAGGDTHIFVDEIGVE